LGLFLLLIIRFETILIQLLVKLILVVLICFNMFLLLVDHLIDLLLALDSINLCLMLFLQTLGKVFDEFIIFIDCISLHLEMLIVFLRFIMEFMLLFNKLFLKEHLLLGETSFDHMLNFGSFLYFMLDQSNSCCFKLIMSL